MPLILAKEWACWMQKGCGRSTRRWDHLHTKQYIIYMACTRYKVASLSTRKTITEVLNEDLGSYLPIRNEQKTSKYVNSLLKQQWYINFCTYLLGEYTLSKNKLNHHEVNVSVTRQIQIEVLVLSKIVHTVFTVLTAAQLFAT